MLPLTLIASPPQEGTLQVEDLKDCYQLSVPVSQLIMKIPKGGLKLKISPKGPATQGPRYFDFDDDARHLIISGWYESADHYPGVKKFWEGETNGWKRRGFPKPQDVSLTKVGGWDAVFYDQSIQGTPVASSHSRAEWVEAGTWIDLHIEVTSDSPSAERREEISAFLKTIQVTKRSENGT